MYWRYGWPRLMNSMHYDLDRANPSHSIPILDQYTILTLLYLHLSLSILVLSLVIQHITVIYPFTTHSFNNISSAYLAKRRPTFLWTRLLGHRSVIVLLHRPSPCDQCVMPSSTDTMHLSTCSDFHIKNSDYMSPRMAHFMALCATLILYTASCASINDSAPWAMGGFPKLITLLSQCSLTPSEITTFLLSIQ